MGTARRRLLARVGSHHETKPNRNKCIWSRLWMQGTLFRRKERHMNSIIYVIGLIVVVLAILSFLGMA
jgi:hypothetical protein